MKKEEIYSDFPLNFGCMVFEPFLTLFALATYPFPFVLFLLFVHRMQTWSINQIKSLSTLILSPYKCPLSLPLFSRYTRQFCFSLLLSHSPVWSRRNRGGRIIRRNSDYYLRTQFDQFGTEAVLHFIPSDCSDLLFRVAIRQASLQTDASLWFVEVAFFTRQSIFLLKFLILLYYLLKLEYLLFIFLFL